MDDFVLSNLHESRNEWCSRLVSIFCPLVMEGIQSIFQEACKVCDETNQKSKYLMTFQNFILRIPKWNSVIVEEERKRIIERSGCNYLEDLITCVHIIQLKVLTCIRVGNRQKKIDITIPKLDHFIHKVYINVARKVYMNVYLFERGISNLQIQKNTREFEIIVQECILTTIRESIPTEDIIRAYMDESVEHEEEVTIEPIAEPVLEAVKDGKSADGTIVSTEATEDTKAESSGEIPSIEEDMPVIVEKPKIENLDDKPVKTTLSFNNVHTVFDQNGNKEEVDVTKPKVIERLEEVGLESALEKKIDVMDLENASLRTDDIDLGDLIIPIGDDVSSSNKTEDLELSALDLGIEEI
jgi:Family of unknown function (DUF5764)